MTVGELKKELETLEDDVEINIEVDGDETEYTLDSVEVSTDGVSLKCS